jgi:hypothetical protein
MSSIGRCRGSFKRNVSNLAAPETIVDEIADSIATRILWSNAWTNLVQIAKATGEK